MQRSPQSANQNQEIIRVKILEMSNKLGRNENVAAIYAANDVINTYSEEHFSDVVQFAYRIRASAWVRMGEFPAALIDADKALSLDGGKKDIFSYQSRAVAKFAMADYYGAIGDANRALELYQEFASAYVLRAQARLRIGESSLAKEDAERAIKISTADLADNASGDDRHYRQAFLLRERATAKRVINDIIGAVADETRAAQLTSVACMQQQRLFAPAATVNVEEAEANKRQKLLDDLIRSEAELALYTSCVPK